MLGAGEKNLAMEAGSRLGEGGLSSLASCEVWEGAEGAAEEVGGGTVLGPFAEEGAFFPAWGCNGLRTGYQWPN